MRTPPFRVNDAPRQAQAESDSPIGFLRSLPQRIKLLFNEVTGLELRLRKQLEQGEPAAIVATMTFRPDNNNASFDFNYLMEGEFVEDVEITYDDDGFQVDTPSELTPTITNPNAEDIVYTLESGTLPTGMTLDADTGVISGTPTVPGTEVDIIIRGTYTADDGTIHHVDSPAFDIQVYVLPSFAAIVGQAGVHDVPFGGFTPTITNPSALTILYSVSAGTLPTGITQNVNTSALTGTPTVIEVQAGIVLTGTFTDIGGDSHTFDSNSFTFTIT